MWRVAGRLPLRGSGEFGGEVAAGVAGGAGGDLFGGAGGYDVASGVAAFGTDVDDVVGAFDYIEVVLDDYNSMAFFNQPVE